MMVMLVPHQPLPLSPHHKDITLMPIISIIGLVVATVMFTLVLGVVGALALVQLDVAS